MGLGDRSRELLGFLQRELTYRKRKTDGGGGGIIMSVPHVSCYTLNQLKFWGEVLKVTSHSLSGRRSFRCSAMAERPVSAEEVGAGGASNHNRVPEKKQQSLFDYRLLAFLLILRQYARCSYPSIQNRGKG